MKYKELELELREEIVKKETTFAEMENRKLAQRLMKLMKNSLNPTHLMWVALGMELQPEAYDWLDILTKSSTKSKASSSCQVKVFLCRW
jgi:hypothetical protein